MPIPAPLAAALLTLAPVADPVLAHAAALAGIRSIHMKSETWLEPSPALGVAERTLATRVESWRDGTRERTVMTAFVVVTQTGMEFIPEGRPATTLFDGRETRRLDGWNPDRPVPLPAPGLLSLWQTRRVSGTITAQSAPPETALTRFSTVNGISLARIAELGELAVVGRGPDAVTLEVRAPKIPYLDGAKISFDPRHGYHVRRVESKAGAEMSVVEEFAQTAGGFWYPKRGRAGETTGEITACEINEPVPAGILDVTFPAGMTVYDRDGVVHVWGEGGPARSFTHPEFERYREEQTLRALRPWFAAGVALLTAGIVLGVRRLRGRLTPAVAAG